MSDATPELVEGTDYYVEGGRWVFTAAYHRKRGRCCGSGCRHCPFGNSPADRAGGGDTDRGDPEDNVPPP